MNVREKIEADERVILSVFAVLAEQSRGRERPEPPADTRTCFMRDRDRIIHCKSFRRLKHKTQVFVSPEGDHYRTRLTHTLEVAQISRTVARGLSLNEDLTEAIALGHDLGHTPFGHAGERALSQMCPEGFAHNEQSLRVVRRIEKDGMGLNLTREVCDGIVCHTGEKWADTREGRIVHYADRIAYINHDIDDAVRAGILTPGDIPREVVRALGKTHSQRVDTLVLSMLETGSRPDCPIGLDDACSRAMNTLWGFMMEAVYRNPVAKGEEVKGMEILKQLFSYFIKHTDAMPEEYRRITEEDGPNRAVCDYVAGMTDRFAVAKYSELFIPKGWSKI